MPEPISITNPEDSRIAVFRDIRERDLTGRGGFIAEGSVVLDQLLASSTFRATALLVLENRLAGLLPRLERLQPDTPLYVANRAVIDRIAGFPLHRGVLAHGMRIASPPGEEDEMLARIAAAGGVVVVLVGIANHDNMGGIFRNAAAFGALAVLVDPGCCDPLYRKAIRVSVGSVLTVPFWRSTPAEALLHCLARHGFRAVALSPRGHAPLASLAGVRGPVALFLGSEGGGLPEALMTGMETVRIAMAPGFDSLNVATAGALALHQLYSARARA